jgi:DNA-binding CsgD family transcriptional regulator
MQMFMLNRELGRLGSFEPVIRAVAESHSERAWIPGLMLMCVELGLMAQARVLFEQFASRDFEQVARDDMFVAHLVFCAETCCALGDTGRAVALYNLLLPYAEQAANHPRAVCFGSTQLFLARLAQTAREGTMAGEHFESAVRSNREMRAWPMLARTLYHYGAFVLDTNPEDPRGRALLTEADQLAGRLTMAALGRDIDRLLRGTIIETPFPDELTVREVDVLRLIAIGRSNKDISKVLAISLNTVATHVRSILNKTGCVNRTEAAVYAMRHESLALPSSDREVV